MKENITRLKIGVERFAASKKLEIYELYTEMEGEASEEAFAKQYATTAFEIFQMLLIEGIDIRLNITTVFNRSRSCNFDYTELGFWEDLGMIVDLYEFLKNGIWFENIDFGIGDEK